MLYGAETLLNVYHISLYRFYVFYENYPSGLVAMASIDL